MTSGDAKSGNQSHNRICILQRIDTDPGSNVFSESPPMWCLALAARRGRGASSVRSEGRPEVI
jgi:hypothetical protein